MTVWKNSLRKYSFYKISGKSIYFYWGLSELEFDTKENVIIKDGKTFALTNDNLCILLNKVSKDLLFLVDGDKATIIELNNAKLMYKRKNKTTYCFLYINEKGVFHYELPLTAFLKSINFETFERCKDNNFSKEAFLPFYESAKQNGDKYATCLIDYLSNLATKEDVDFLNEYEKNDRLFVDKKVYDIEDILDIKDIKLNRRGSMFGWRISYEFYGKINGTYHKLQYFPPSWDKPFLMANCAQGKIEITKRLLDKIKVLTGETESNRRTRSLMQLGNFLYCYDGTLSRYPLEQQNKVFDQMSKVTLEDLKSLPLHWLKKLSKPMFYDWLKCAGYSGDAKANEFVEELLKGSN